MVKYFSVRALEAEKTTKTKWILNCGTPCTFIHYVKTILNIIYTDSICAEYSEVVEEEDVGKSEFQ